MKINNIYSISRIGFLIFFFLMILLTIYVFLNYSAMESKMLNLIDKYGLLAIFSISFFADILIQPIGPDVTVIGGILMDINFLYVIVLASSGSVLASFCSFLFGKTFRNFGLRHLNSSKNYKKWERIYMRYGLLTLSIGAISPIPYVPMCWIAGIFRIRVYKFVLFGMLPRALRFVTLGMIIHYFQILY